MQKTFRPQNIDLYIIRKIQERGYANSDSESINFAIEKAANNLNFSELPLLSYEEREKINRNCKKYETKLITYRFEYDNVKKLKERVCSGSELSRPRVSFLIRTALDFVAISILQIYPIEARSIAEIRVDLINKLVNTDICYEMLQRIEKQVESEDYEYEKYVNDFLNVIRTDPTEEQLSVEIINRLLKNNVKYYKVVRVENDRAGNSGTDSARRKYMHTIAKDGKNVSDYILVSKNFTYENPEEPEISVEVKFPDVDIDYSKKKCIKKYNPLFNKLKGLLEENKDEKRIKEDFLETQIGAELLYTKKHKLIYTDGIQWIFIRKKENGIFVEEQIELLDAHQEWSYTEFIKLRKIIQNIN